LNLLIEKLQADQRKLSIICFSLFSGWLLTIPFEGQVLYTIISNTQISGTIYNTIAVFAHFIGLFVSGFLIRRQISAKVTMITSTIVCISGSLIFFLPFSILWGISIISVSFFAGLFVASWGFYFKTYSEPDQRIKTAADVLIYSNIIMIFTNAVAINISPFIGLTITIILLFGALITVFKLESVPIQDNSKKIYTDTQFSNICTILKPFIFLCLFILVITINSGLMYQVVNPAFAHHELLVSFYWAVPYILALVIIRNQTIRIDSAFLLYVALTMIGFSYILFMLLDRSVVSYLIIDTLMLGAFGVCDLFWWSIIGALLDYVGNPAKILGIGLSMNVLGILIGEIIATTVIPDINANYGGSILALIIIFSVIIMLPVLNALLTKLLKKHAFLVKFANVEGNKQDKVLPDHRLYKQLTEREISIVELLRKGYTYKAIAENLFISENTMKYHIKNIYQKLNVNSKMELIKMFVEDNKSKES